MSILKLDLRQLEIAMAKAQVDRKKLASEANVSESTINAYFQQRVQPSLVSLGRIAAALNVDVKDLIHD